MPSSLVVSYKGITLREFDLDAALAQKPQLILVDELAHSNAQGCRHVKRYQDIEELLRRDRCVHHRQCSASGEPKRPRFQLDRCNGQRADPRLGI